jgi:hypothetical protein
MHLAFNLMLFTIYHLHKVVFVLVLFNIRPSTPLGTGLLLFAYILLTIASERLTLVQFIYEVMRGHKKQKQNKVKVKHQQK